VIFPLAHPFSNPDGTGVGAGMGGGCGSGSTHQDQTSFMTDVGQRWVKLSPNQTHSTECLLGLDLASTGSWKVYLTYRRVRLTSEKKLYLASVGCRALTRDIGSQPVRIEVEEGQEW